MAITPADLETLVKIIKATEATRGNMYEYTITGATDWTMLITVGGGTALILTGVVSVLVGVIWRTLPKKVDLDNLATRFGAEISNLADRWEASIEKALLRQEHATTSEIARAINDCQRECCNRRKDDQVSP